MKRRTRGLVFLGIVVAIVVVGSLVVVRTQGERIAIRLGDFATARFGQERNLSIEIGDVGGSLLYNVWFKDVCLTYTGGEAPKILFTASSIYLSFNPAKLILGKVKLDSVGVVSPRISVPQRPDGTRIYPTGDSPKGPKRKAAGVEIDKLAVRDGSFIWEDEEPRVIRGLHLDASYSSGDETSTTVIRKAQFGYGESAHIDSLWGVIRTIEEATELEGLAVKMPHSRFKLWAYLGSGDNDSLAFDAVIDSLDFSEVSSFYGGDDSVNVGMIRGRARGRGRYTRLGLEVNLDGEIYNWPIDDLEAQAAYREKTLALERLTALVNGSPVDLTAEYAFTDPPTYRGVVAFGDLDLSKFVSDGEQSYSSDLNGAVRFRGEALDRERFRLTTWPSLQAGRYRDWEFDQVGGLVTVTSDAVVLDSLLARIHGTSVACSGKIGFDGRTGLDFSIDCQNLEGLYSYHKVSDLKGKIAGIASLAFAEDTLRIRAASEGRDIDYQGTHVDSIVVELELEGVPDRLGGTSRFFASDLDIRGFQASELIGDLKVDGPRINLDRVVLTRADGSLVGVVGEMEVLKDGVAADLANLFVEAGGFIWENRDTVRVSYREDSLTVGDFQLWSDLGTITLLTASYAQGWYHVESSITDFDLGLLKSAIGKEIPTGQLALALSAAGSSDSITFGIDFTIADGEVRSVEFDAIEGRLAYGGETLGIERLMLTSDGGSVTVEGDIPIDLAPRRVLELAKSGRTADLIDDLGTVVVRAEDMDISLLWPLAPPISKFSGTAELELEMSGNKRDPRLRTKGKLANAWYGQTELGEVSWTIGFADSVLAVESLDFVKGIERGSISGRVPLAITMLPFTSRLLTRSIDAAIEVDNGNLALLCEIFPKLKVCSGVYAVDLRIGGDVGDPTFIGSLKLSDARLRWEGVAQDLRDLNLEVAAAGKRFDIVRMVAEEGALSGTGFFALTGVTISDWRLDLTLDGFQVTEFEDFYVKASGELFLEVEKLKSGRAVPRIAGNVEIKEGEYFYSLRGGAGGEAIIGPTAAPTWTMNVFVEIPNAFWIRGGDIDAELQGSLNVKRNEEGLLVLGTLSTLRGRFFIYNNVFRITRGEFRFADVKSLRNVYIDLEARARVLDERIDLLAKGPMDKLDVTATSESGWSETQIFEALTLRWDPTAEGQARGIFSGEFVKSWGLALINRFGDDVVRELHLDRFGIEVGEVGEGDALAATRFTFGKYVSEKLYLEYTQSVGSLYGDTGKLTQRGLSFPERQLSVEYRLSDRFFVEGEAGTVGGLGYFDVDLKFRFGY